MVDYFVEWGGRGVIAHEQSRKKVAVFIVLCWRRYATAVVVERALSTVCCRLHVVQTNFVLLLSHYAVRELFCYFYCIEFVSAITLFG